MNTARLIELRSRLWYDGSRRRLRPPIKPLDNEPFLGIFWGTVAVSVRNGWIGPKLAARIEAYHGFPIPTPESLQIGGAK